MSRLQLSLWLAATAAAVAGASLVIATSDRSSPVPTGLALLVGVSFVASGLIARVRRPANLTGLLLIETGFLWFIGALGESDNAWIYPLGQMYASLTFGPFTQLILAFPSGEVTLRRHRTLLGTVWFLVTVLQTWVLLVNPRLDSSCDDCPENAYAITSNELIANIAEGITTTVAVGLIAWLLVEVVLKYRAASPPLRRTLTPVLVASGAAVTMLALANTVQYVSRPVGNGFGAAFVIGFLLVPFAFLAGVLKSRLARSSVAEVMVRVGSGRPLREVIADALGDPTLAIGYWLPARGEYVGQDGTPIALTGAAGTTEVALDGRPIAVLLHDAALDDERELLRGVAAAAALSLETERLQAELRDQLTLLVTIADTAPSLLVTIDADGRIVNQNRAAVTAAGLDDEEQVRGHLFWDVFIDPEEREAMRERFFAASPTFPPAAYENVFTNARGERRVIAWESAPLHDEDGCVIRIVAGGIDISERKARESDLQRQRDFASTVFDTIPSYLVVVTHDGAVVEDGVNKAFTEAFGWTCDEIAGTSLLEVVAGEAREETALAVARAAEGIVQPERETCWRSRHGEERVVAWTAKAVLDPEGRSRVLVSGADVTERRRQDEEIRASRSRIVEAADDARRKLERNLHDGAQQRLVSLALSLRLAEAKALTEPEKAVGILASAREELGHALDELRELARGIHPAVLTDRGLGPALEAVAARSPVPVALDVQAARLPAPVEAAVYFVVAEGLTNVVRYAEASTAAVVVRTTGGIVEVEVVDDGIGCASFEGGTGLRGLRDRVAALDGELTVTSAPATGTVLRATIPVRPGGDHDRRGRIVDPAGRAS